MVNKKLQIEVVDNFIYNFSDIDSYWQEYTRDYLYDPNDRLPTCDMGEVAHFIKDNILNINIVKKNFILLEDLFLKHRDSDVKLIGYMFIESLINILSHSTYDYKIIEPYLGPLSKKAYDRINAFWMEGKLIESLD